MPLIPKRTGSAPAGGPPKRPSTPVSDPVTDTEEHDETSAPVSEGSDDTDPTSYLSYGSDADKKIEADANSPKNSFWEFFITKDELKKSKNVCAVDVTFAFNYADPQYAIAVPRVTVREGGNFRQVTSAGNDCAVAAAGVQPSLKPAWLLIDHRTYVNKQGEKVTNRAKVWLPPGSLIGLMKSALGVLASELGCDPSSIDIRKHRCVLTKSATGKKTSWSIQFRVKEREFEYEEVVSSFMKMDHYPSLQEYRRFMGKLLAPNPRYMISKGGKYTKPARRDDKDEGGSEADGSEVPF